VIVPRELVLRCKIDISVDARPRVCRFPRCKRMIISACPTPTEH
jgi:hypothetical protein